MKKIKVIRYETLKECLEALGVDPDTKGYWEWADADGIPHKERYGKAIDKIRKFKCWGWADKGKGKREVHVWIGKRATLDDVGKLLAHEIGHLERPFHYTRFAEETKAAKYERVAEIALEAAQELLK